MMTGRHTPEAKAKISAALKGRPRPHEVREKIAATKRGKKASIKHKLSLRVGQRVIKLFKPELYEANRARSRATMIANWNDPAFIARWRIGREKHRQAQAERRMEASQ